MRKCWVLFTAVLLLGLPVYAQETGSISGTITLDDGTDLPGVTVTAAGDVLPQDRTVISDAAGEYRFIMLPPGNYELTFALEGMATQARTLEVLLERNSVVNVTMTSTTVTDVIEVTAADAGIDITSTAVKSALPSETVEALPVGQEYRDFLKLAPGVQYTEDSIRGPSAGGNGQDNVYKIDGVDVGLPLFGTLSSEPAAYDIEQVSFIKGGVKATDFNRSGGLTINSVTRSGTNRWKGFLGYQVQTASMTGDVTEESNEEFDEDKNWLTFGIGGPILQDKLFFYGSYYRPEVTRDSVSNLYGDVPDYESIRDEFFGKLTWTPTDNLLLNGGYRDSDRDDSGTSVAEDEAGTTSEGSVNETKTAFIDGSWLINDRSNLTFKYTDFETVGGDEPDNLLNFTIGPGVNLDVDNLDQQGYFDVPFPIDGNADFNSFIQPLIDRYGYLENGARTGGGAVGVSDTIDIANYFREAVEIGYDYFLGNHQLHGGYEWYEVSEERGSFSNGWGWIEVPGNLDGNGVYYTGRFWQQSLGDEVPIIRSFLESQSFEINDTFTLNKWTFNAGFLFSNDTYYGAGLRETGQGVSGFEVSPGSKYEMYDIGFDEMIQPRLGATWSWNGREKAYGSYARYNPAASSLPRAASWDRNLQREIFAQFDENGTFLGVDPVRASSGKFFEDGIDPRYIDEFLVGYDRQINSRWTARSSFRYRKGRNFWEDTNNNARVDFEPPAGIPRELYVPNLDEVRAEIGGSSYVIAQLDDAFTDYYEVSLSSEYRDPKYYVQASYVWSQYYGNFDQDNTSGNNDNSIFIGSSNIADGPGRQVWDKKYGYLRGDRRNQFRVYGYYNLAWNGSAAAWINYQDGQPWEAWDANAYRPLYGGTNDIIRFAEPAGSNRTDSHFQMDLNYTQNFPLGDRFNVKLRADLFNVFDSQTGYDIEPSLNSANFGTPRDFYRPRRLQLAVGFDF
jgi:hypothetical protein